MDLMEHTNKDYNKIIGSNIRFERQKRDLTIEELSEILNIAPGFLGLIERGQRGTSIKNLCRISEFFDISLDQLITKPAGTIIKSDEELAAERDEKKKLKDKHNIAVSLIKGFVDNELDCIIPIIKSIHKLTKIAVKGKNKTKDDDSSFDDDSKENITTDLDNNNFIPSNVNNDELDDIDNDELEDIDL